MGGMYSPPLPPAPPPAPRDRRASDGEGWGETPVLQTRPQPDPSATSRIVVGVADPLTTPPNLAGSRPASEGQGYGFGGGSGPTSRQGPRGNRKQVRRIAQPEFGTRPDNDPRPDPHKPPTRPSGGQGARQPGGFQKPEGADDAIARQIQAIRQRRKAEEATPGAQPWPKTLADALQRFQEAYAKSAGQGTGQQAGLAQAGSAQGETRDGRDGAGKAGLVAHVPERKLSYPPGAMILVPDSANSGAPDPFAKHQDLPHGIVLAQAAPLEELDGGAGTDARPAAPRAGSSAKPIDLTSPDSLEPQDMPVHDRRRDFWIRQQFRTNGGLDVQPGTTIRENSIIYGHMHEALQTREGAIRSKWWDVASDVTGPLGVGAADPLAVNGTVFNEKDEKFLQTVSHTLAPMNFRNYQYLVQGQEIPGLEGLRGKDLDYALVEMEQKAVTAIMDQYFKENPGENRAEIMKNMTEAMMPVNAVEQILGGAVRVLAEDSAAAVAYRLFPNGDYDFANEEHRIALGKALVDLRYRDGAEGER